LRWQSPPASRHAETLEKTLERFSSFAGIGFFHESSEYLAAVSAPFTQRRGQP